MGARGLCVCVCVCVWVSDLNISKKKYTMGRRLMNLGIKKSGRGKKFRFQFNLTWHMPRKFWVYSQASDSRVPFRKTPMLILRWCSRHREKDPVDLITIIYFIIFEKCCVISPGWCGSVDWPEGCWFNAKSGHMLGLHVRSQWGALKRQQRIDIFLSLYHPPSSLSKNK